MNTHEIVMPLPHVAPKRHAISRLAQLAAAVGLGILLVGCGGGSDSSTTPTTQSWSGPLVMDGKVNPRLEGAWRILGTGQLVEFKGDLISEYVQTTSACYPMYQPVSVNFAFEFNPQTKLVGTQSNGSERIDLHLADLAWSDATFEKLPALPSNCGPAADTPHATLTAFAETMESQYAFFKERGIDWQSRKDTLLRSIPASAAHPEVFAVMAASLANINDAHVSLNSLRSPELAFNGASPKPSGRLLQEVFQTQTETRDYGQFLGDWMARTEQSIRAELTDGGYQALGGALLYGKLPGNVGYLRLTQESGYRVIAEGQPLIKEMEQLGAEVDKAIAYLSGTDAMVLDLSFNTGGLEMYSVEVAGRFADKQRLASSTSYHRPEGRATQQRYVTPKGPKQYTKPVYMLTSDMTVSAGESLVLLMRALPHVTHAGEPTHGILSDMQHKHLPGGFSLTLSNQRLLDAQGISYESVGIPPKVPVRIFDTTEHDALYTGQRDAIRSVVTMLGKR